MENLPTISLYQVFRNRKRILENPLPFHHENFEKFGDSFRVKVGWGKSVVFTRNPRLIKHILQKQHRTYYKSALQTVDLAKYIGHGLLTSNGDHWLTHRRMVQPAFHREKLKGLLAGMKAAITTELQRIKSDENQDIFPLMGDLAFQVVAKTLFSRDDIQESMARLQHITEANQKMLIREMRQPYLKWWFNWSGEIKRHTGLAEEGQSILNGIIEDRINSGEEKDDLLDMLLAARYEDGTAMSRKQLIDEVMILFTAGHETSANALSFTLYFLAKHQDIQEKAYTEISALDVDNGHEMEVISKLTFVKRCIEESMRLYPPAYYIDRVAIEEDRFEDRTIPKNSMILMSMYELHRYQEFWDHPNDFKPERFNTLNSKDYQEYYYPFGAGPRMCVGNNFAMYEMVLTVAEILRKYRLSSKNKTVEINPLISLKPKQVPIFFEIRT